MTAVADTVRAAGLDPKATAWRPDLAAADLEGRLSAARYASGAAHEVTALAAPVSAEPDPAAPMTSQLLLGEPFTAYEIAGGWAWGQCGLDDYVGYVPAAALAPAGPPADHRVGVPAALVFPAPELKRRPSGRVGLGARVTVQETAGRFARIGPDRWVARVALAPLDGVVVDWAATAERFLGVPYLWGGRSADGLDCSGLVQVALQAAGFRVPRDSDQQAAAGPGTPVDPSAGLRRGDVVFFPDHIAIMVDDARVVHANAAAMAVTIDPLTSVAERVAADDPQRRGITFVRRPTLVSGA